MNEDDVATLFADAMEHRALVFYQYSSLGLQPVLMPNAVYHWSSERASDAAVSLRTEEGQGRALPERGDTGHQRRSVRAVLRSVWHDLTTCHRTTRTDG